jgi:translation initiation factor eIF-2B subunit delta
MAKKKGLLELMQKDLIHGASWYFEMAIKFLESTGGNNLAENIEAIRHLRPMGSLTNLIELLQDVRNEGEFSKKISNLKKYRINAENDLKIILSKLGFRSFITISHSAALLSLLEVRSPKSMYLMESRPGSEARRALTEYSKYTEVIIVPDSAICVFIEKSDAVIFGADGIYSAGFAINKIGSRPLAACAKMQKVPVYVIMETYKACDTEPSFDTERDFRYSGKSIKVPLFEKIPLNEIDYLITETGIFTNPTQSDVKHMHDHFIQSVREI